MWGAALMVSEMPIVVRSTSKTILGKVNVIMTLGGRGSRTMMLIRSALFRISWPCYVETTDEKL